MQVELEEIEPGFWAYRVGHFYQPFDPELSGRVLMTRERAQELGEATLALLVQG